MNVPRPQSHTSQTNLAVVTNNCTTAPINTEQLPAAGSAHMQPLTSAPIGCNSLGIAQPGLFQTTGTETDERQQKQNIKFSAETRFTFYTALCKVTQKGTRNTRDSTEDDHTCPGPTLPIPNHTSITSPHKPAITPQSPPPHHRPSIYTSYSHLMYNQPQVKRHAQCVNKQHTTHSQQGLPAM